MKIPIGLSTRFNYTETTQVLEKSSSEHSVLTDSTFRFLRNLNYFQYNIKSIILKYSSLMPSIQALQNYPSSSSVKQHCYNPDCIKNQ